MRPIDADELLQTIQEWDSSIRAYAHPVNSVIHEVLDGVADIITDLDTIDYAPVKRGEFEFQEFEYIPGLCVAPVHCKTCDTTYFTINKDGKRTACCPYCGARMDEKEDDDG